METENSKVASLDSGLHSKIETQDKEIERLNEEVKRLQQCVRGVNVLGRALKETKKENERLLQTSMTEKSATDLENSIDLQSITSTIQTSDANESEIQGSLPDMEAPVKVISSDNMESIDEFPDEEGRNESDTENEISQQPHLKQESNDEVRIDDQNNKDGEKTDDSLNSSIDDDKTSLVKVSNICNPDDATGKFASNDDAGPIENDVQVVTNNDGSSDLRSSNQSTGKPAQPQNITKGTPGINSNVKDCENDECREKKQGNVIHEKVSETENVDLKGRCEGLTKENAELKLEFKKVLKVNNEWESFWRTKNSSITKEIMKKDATIAELQKFKAEHDACAKNNASKMDKGEDVNKIETKKLEKALLTEEHANELEAMVEQQRKEITEERQKYERTHKLARSLLQQNKELSEEVKRLNGTLQTKVELYKSLQLSIASGGPGSLHNGSANEEALHRMTEPPPIEQTQMLRSGLEYEHDEEYHQRQGNEEEDHQQQQLEQQIGNDDDSMSAEELRERIMLLKEQKNAYESDFRKERRDREDVVGELERTKERLERAKQKVKQKKSNRGHRPPFSNYVEVQTAGRNQPVAYLYPPNERNQLIARGVQQRVPQRNDWYRYPDQPIIGGQDGDLPCLCPRHHYHTP